MKSEMSLEQIRAFMAASEEVEFEGKSRKEVYEWLRTTLVAQEYHRQGKAAKGVVKAYLEKMTGLSRAQITRLVGQYIETGEIKEEVSKRRRFPAFYTREDIELLAAVDEVHETLSGPATIQIMYRELHEFNKLEYERLAGISVGHLYNLRGGAQYRNKRTVFEKTKPTAVGIGERRKPEPNGQPGHVRVDTVHQGDKDGVKGVYHINAVDEVTQWQIVGAVAHISEAWLMPVLEDMLEQFPFHIRGFHSDNGSEFINERVQKLLNKLLAEQTKSRPRRSNDNGLAETKNGSVIRKHIGYGHIASEHAEAINRFYKESFNCYLNFHRPCGVPEIKTDSKGKEKKVYKWHGTPWEILRRIPDLARHLKAGLTVDELNRRARAESPNESARRMQEAKHKLYAAIHQKKSA